MSYILDALQRAAMERERASSAVPGLQTHAFTAGVATPKSSRVMIPRRLVLILAIVLTTVALAFMLRFITSEPRLSVSPSPTASSVAVPGALAVAQPAMLSPTLATPEPIRVNPPAALSAAAGKALTQVQPTKSISVGGISPKTAPVSPQPSSSQRLRAKAEQAAETTPPLLKELPDAIRAQIPPLFISGVVYSDDPAQRLLLINGQVLKQGSRAAEDLVLDEIHPKSSDFTFRGTRFKLSHRERIRPPADPE